MIIEAHNISKSYGELKVLDNVSLSINEGELISIVGKSGAGKSTLLHILGSLEQADEGKVNINGKSLSGLKNKDLSVFRNKNIGFVFQFHHLLPEFTAIENVCMPALIQHMDKKEAEKRAIELLNYLGLSARKSHKPNELSGGEQQRVAVARALMNKPAVVFADEPTGNLDTQNSKDLHELFLKLASEMKQTFVIVTHNPQLADMSHRCLKMVDGRLEN